MLLTRRTLLLSTLNHFKMDEQKSVSLEGLEMNTDLVLCIP